MVKNKAFTVNNSKKSQQFCLKYFNIHISITFCVYVCVCVEKQREWYDYIHLFKYILYFASKQFSG